jgi:hypothetical protein
MIEIVMVRVMVRHSVPTSLDDAEVIAVDKRMRKIQMTTAILDGGGLSRLPGERPLLFLSYYLTLELNDNIFYRELVLSAVRSQNSSNLQHAISLGLYDQALSLYLLTYRLSGGHPFYSNAGLLAVFTKMGKRTSGRSRS